MRNSISETFFQLTIGLIKKHIINTVSMKYKKIILEIIEINQPGGYNK